MEEVYKFIYKDRYSCKPSEIDDAKQLILKNLDEFNLKKKDIKDWVVFNVGTGREAITFSKIGVKKCYIADISPYTKLSLEKLKEKGSFSNVISITADICQNDFSLPEKVDFVYLNGVYHHLHSPIEALKNINKFTKIGSRIYYRLYKTGSLKFFIADYVRRFLNYEDHIFFNEAFESLFGEVLIDKDLSHSDPKVHLYMMCFDDMFVPVLNLFHPENLYEYYEDNGYKALNKLKDYSYKHEVLNKGGTGYSAYFIKEKDLNIKKDSKNLMASIDQLKIKYSDNCIIKTVDVMNKALNNIKKLSAFEKNKLSIELFFISQIFRLKHYCDVMPDVFDINEIDSLSNGESIHKKIQTKLINYV